MEQERDERPKIVDLIPDKLPSFQERKRLRLAAGLTGTQLASVMGVSAAAVYGWERNRDPGGLFREEYIAALNELKKLDATSGNT